MSSQFLKDLVRAGHLVTNEHTQTQSLTNTHTNTHTWSLTNTHRHMVTNTYTHTLPFKGSPSLSALGHTHTHIYTHTYTPSFKGAHTHTHTHTLLQGHTHTHTHPPHTPPSRAALPSVLIGPVGHNATHKKKSCTEKMKKRFQILFLSLPPSQTVFFSLGMEGTQVPSPPIPHPPHLL